MGHERVGVLPRSKSWQQVLATLTHSNGEEAISISEIAQHTLNNVRKRYERIHKDSGVKAAFAYILSLSTYHYQRPEALNIVGLDLENNPSSVRIAAKLSERVFSHADSMEYAEIARRAGSDTIAQWVHERTKQTDFFEDSSSVQKIWQSASEASGFCEVARLFFAKFTERYLRYFLEREASAEFHSIESREQFSENLSLYMDAVSQHAFETSKITQSFAAGWFNNHAKKMHPSDQEIEAFLALSFGKIQEELRRETMR